MVARIRSGKSLKGALNYNERKVMEGKARLLGARGYSKEEEKLSYHDKLLRLQKLAALNERTTTHCLHLSLNFHPSELLSKETLLQVADTFMDRIGFGRQPYLIYQHFDAAHGHLHIVTTNIQRDGKRISLHNLGKGLSEIARKEIELQFGLVKASGKETEELPLKAVDLAAVLYGKVETKRALSHLVLGVVQQYAYASLAELNAVLKAYNVTAYRGEEGTLMFQKKGLVYSLLNEKGERVGVPIKASAIYGKPTLSRLEEYFEKGKVVKRAARVDMRSKLTPLLLPGGGSLEAFKEALQQHGISLVPRINEQGFLYGVTYVDHKEKMVFNGSDLGKAFSAAALRQRWGEGFQTEGKTKEENRQKGLDSFIPVRQTPLSAEGAETLLTNPWEVLVAPDPEGSYVAYELKKKRKRKKRFRI